MTDRSEGDRADGDVDDDRTRADVDRADVDRAERLRRLADRVSDREGVTDAWLAKSFTDRLLVVEVPPDAELPDAVASTLEDRGFRGADEAYDVDGASDAAFAGELSDGRRYRFVDCESRGELQSYVVD